MRAKAGNPAKELVADFDLAFQSDAVHITVHARGGSASQGTQTNQDYEVLIQTLLERLQLGNCQVQDVLLASRTVSHLSRSQRRITLGEFTFPIRLIEVQDLTKLRLAIRRSVVTAHSTSKNVTHGNATKRIELVATSSASATQIVSLLEWGAITPRLAAAKDETAVDPIYFEGGLVLRTHLVRERNRPLVEMAKARFNTRHGRLYCEACGFDFLSTYGELGDNFIEAHHEDPLSERTATSPTAIEDLRMLCANCHRMLHRDTENGIKSVDELRLILSQDHRKH